MTRTVAVAPITATTIPLGTLGGSSTPKMRSERTRSAARPAKKTSLPSVPVCQPVTESDAAEVASRSCTSS